MKKHPGLDSESYENNVTPPLPGNLKISSLFQCTCNLNRCIYMISKRRGPAKGGRPELKIDLENPSKIICCKRLILDPWTTKPLCSLVPTHAAEL